MFPDRAALYVVAIEDRQYKDFKIHCKSPLRSLLGFSFVIVLFLFLHIYSGRHFNGAEVSSRSHEHTAMSVESPLTLSGFFCL